ncbi:hypothetical protein [Phocaeicola sp.]
MENKLGKTLKNFAAEWKLGDFIRNFIAVVLGIVITFIGSDMIEEHNTNNEVKRALVLVKNELQANRQDVEVAQNWIILQNTAARFIMRHKKDLSQAPADSLQKYINIPFQWCSVHFTNDALELLKSSSLFQKINNEQLALSLIQVYGSIDQTSNSFLFFNNTKTELANAAINHPKLKNIDIESISTIERWKQILSTFEGIAFIKQIPQIFGGERPFDDTLGEIDQVIKAIEDYE